MGSIITLHVGQCGNQIGAEYWDKLCVEHKVLNKSNVELRNTLKDDRKDTFFYESSNGKYFPRALLIDLEPRVVSSVVNSREGVFSSDSLWVSSEGGGAGNVWARGYQRGKDNAEPLIDALQREAESSDNLDGFIMFHSIGGGTGSGLGSFLLESIRDTMEKKIIQTVSILPNNEEISDAVVQPYNVVLTLRRLIECSDNVIVMDNGALTRAAGEGGRLNANFIQINRYAAGVVAAETGPIRFPGSRFSDLSSLVALSAPFKGCHFLVPSYLPFNYSRRISCTDMQRRLFMHRSQLVCFEESEANCLIAAVNIMGNTSLEEAEKSMHRLRAKGGIRFSPGVPGSVQIGLSRSPVSGRTGLLLSNTTGFARALHKNISQYDRLRKRNAFLDVYRREDPGIEEELDSAREAVQTVIDTYKHAELSESPIS